MEVSDRDSILARRRSKFEAMGVNPTFSQQEVEQASNTGMGAKNVDTYSRIQQIKNGSYRDTMRELNNAKSPNEFEAIPTTRPKMNPKDPRYQEDVQRRAESARQNGLDKKPSVKSTGYEGVESMFDGGSSDLSFNQDVVMGNSWEQRRQNANPQNNQNQNTQYHEQPQQLIQQPVSDDLFMGDIGDWESAFKAKRDQAAKQQSVQQEVDLVSPNQKSRSQNQPIDMNGLFDRIEDLINKTVDRRMGDIVSDVIKNKTKTISENTYKKVKDKNGNIIKNIIVIDGKFYKLEEVEYKNPTKK